MQSEKSQVTPTIEDLDFLELDKVLSPVCTVNEVKKILAETLSSEVKAGHISPLTVDPRVVNNYIKKVIKQITSRVVKLSLRGRKASFLGAPARAKE